MLVSWLLVLPFDQEGGGITFLRNIDRLVPDYMVIHPGERSHSPYDLC
jgi:glutamate racemase